jgi:hypothetical protein
VVSNSDELVDILTDLLHDLGKYIYMPLAMLPPDAPDGDFREALGKALFETRGTTTRTRSAREIWKMFLMDENDRLREVAGFAVLHEIVGKALAWEEYLRPGGPPLPRHRVEHDLAQISVAIRTLLKELSDDG